MPTPRSLHDAVSNALDYLMEASLVVYTSQVSLNEYGSGLARVSFQTHTAAPFLVSHDHPTVEQFIAWAESGAYSAMLLDGSLLQLTYDLQGDEVIGHRLGFAPCPYVIDRDLLEAGEPLIDVLELYRSGDALLRSPVRFDFDPANEARDHPASHLTFNGVDCRIACAAPVHPLRFIDFIFRHFYKPYWDVHPGFFQPAAARHLGAPTLTDDDRAGVHLNWDVHAKGTGLTG